MTINGVTSDFAHQQVPSLAPWLIWKSFFFEGGGGTGKISISLKIKSHLNMLDT